MEGRVDGGRRNVERGADQGKAERTGAVVIDRSMDWKASLVNRAWSILRQLRTKPPDQCLWVVQMAW